MLEFSPLLLAIWARFALISKLGPKRLVNLKAKDNLVIDDFASGHDVVEISGRTMRFRLADGFEWKSDRHGGGAQTDVLMPAGLTAI